MKHQFVLLTIILVAVAFVFVNFSASSLVQPSEAHQIRTSSLHSASPLNEQLQPFSTMPQNYNQAIEWIVAARKRKGQRATLLQIGANDGQLFDPFWGVYHERMEEWHDDWMALLVEPQPDLYAQVAVFHAMANDWAFYLGAIAGPSLCINGTIQFCETKTPGVGDWRTQGQVNTIKAQTCHPGNDRMHLQKRPCVTSFADLMEHASPGFRQHALDASGSKPRYNLDFLQIDVEGADFAVLQLIDWDVIRPQCIQYEQHHLGENKPVAKAFVESKGYLLVDSVMDVLACRVST